MWCSALALASCLAIFASPAGAQAGPSLEDLIPNEAVSDPEAWARQGAQPQLPTPDGEAEELEADSPIEPMPLLTLEDPEDIDLPDIEPIETVEEIEFVQFDDVIRPLPEGSVVRISDELVLAFPSDRSLFPERDEFLSRFKALSSVEDLDDDGSRARLAAQSRADEELLQRMLRTYGYFDGQVIRSVVVPEGVENATDQASIARFDIVPGQRFAVGTVDTDRLIETGDDYKHIRAAYKVYPGDLISIDSITDAALELDYELADNGYPFAEVGEPSLLVDHERQEGDVTQPVSPGGKYVFGQVTSNLEDFLSSQHLMSIARFDAGDTYRRVDQIDLQRAILATGLVGSVRVEPVEAEAPADGSPGTVDMAVNMTPAPLRTVTGSLGYGTEEGVRVAASWEHRNLFPSEGMLRIRGIAGTQEQLLGATFRKNNFHGRDRSLTINAFGHSQRYDFYKADTLSLIGQYERISTLLFQKPISYGAGVELVATSESEIKVKGAKSPDETYLIAALPLFAQYDTSDDLLNPREGFRVRGAASPEISRLNGNNSTYLKLQFDLSYYQPLGENIVLASRARAGTIQGTEVSNIAPSRRFYAGGGGSVRGYGYQSIGPRNGAGEPNGGRSLVELSAEVRIRTGLMDDAIEFVPFIDAGTVDRSTTPDFNDIRVGVGLGVRYHSNFGPIRVDVGVPLDRQPGDAPVAVYVALGQAF